MIVSNDAVVVAYSARQAGDMNEAKPLATRPAWLGPEAPVASMSYMDIAGMMSAVSSWVRYGFMLTIGDLDTPLGENPDNNVPVPTAQRKSCKWGDLSVLGKTASTTVIDESGATVSRWVWGRRVDWLLNHSRIGGLVCSKHRSLFEATQSLIILLNSAKWAVCAMLFYEGRNGRRKFRKAVTQFG